MRDALDDARVNYVDVRVIKDKNTGKRFYVVGVIIFNSERRVLGLRLDSCPISRLCMVKLSH